MFFLLPINLQAAEDADSNGQKAVLQILNKTTAKTAMVEIKVGSSLIFQQIEIKAIKCWQAPLDQNPDARILIEVKKINSKKEKEKIFHGWMIASSPSISSLEDPVYDITAISCK